MPFQYTITLSDAQNKALGYVAASQQEWIENAVYVRCAKAIDEIVNAEIQRRLAAGETISGSKDDIVMSSPIKSAADRDAELRASQTENT